jgi:hypothetical protein
MSVGSYSSTNSAIRLQTKIDGYAVCSASTQPPSGKIAKTNPNGIIDMGLDKIKVPSVAIGHQDDACPGTPFTGVAKIEVALSNAASVATKIFVGGNPPQSGACGPLSPHGYYGIDQQVVTYLAQQFKSLVGP